MTPEKTPAALKMENTKGLFEELKLFWPSHQVDEVWALHLAQRDIYVDMQDDDGCTLLLLAAAQNKPEIVDALLSRGAQPNIQAHNGRTALVMACMHTHKDIAEALLKAGADPNLGTVHGKTPLSNVLYGAFGSAGLVKLLLGHGADANFINSEGCSYLMQLAHKDEETEIAELLLSFGASLHFRNAENKSAEDIARANGCGRMLEIFGRYRAMMLKDAQNVSLREDVALPAAVRPKARRFAP